MSKRNPKAYGQVLAKCDRADKHIDELNARLDQFKRDNPNVFRREEDTETGDVSFYIEQVPEVPPDIPAIAGDVIHNLRAALDHLVWKLVEAAGNIPTNKTCFPIFDTPAQYKRSAPTKIEGVHKLAKQKFDRIHPYKRGNINLWRLHRLDIIDKHNLLITLGFANFARTMTPSERAKAIAASAPGQPNPQGLGIFVGLTIPTETLKAGSKLLTVPAAEATDDMGFFVDVAINERGIAENANLRLLLNFLRSEVSNTIFDFAPFL